MFYAKHELYTTIGTMKEAEKRLNDFGFFRCNNGYLVNLQHIEGIRDNYEVTNHSFSINASDS